MGRTETGNSEREVDLGKGKTPVPTGHMELELVVVTVMKDYPGNSKQINGTKQKEGRTLRNAHIEGSQCNRQHRMAGLVGDGP